VDQGNSTIRSKRFPLKPQDIVDIMTQYEASDTTQQIGTRYGISKTRVATILREQGVTIRRQGLDDDQLKKAATLYVGGKSLAWLGARFSVSHTTVAVVLRDHASNSGRVEVGADPCRSIASCDIAYA